MTTITADKLSYAIHDHDILSNVRLNCAGGTVTALRGRSGCGKTTLLNLLGMLLSPTSGTLTVNGTPAEHWGDRERCRFWHDHAAFIFQDYGMIPNETVLSNIVLDARAAKRTRRHIPRRLSAILDYLRLQDMALQSVDALSGGERQRVGVARALWKQADFVFADEPTASLDEENKHIVTDLLLDLANKGACVIIATHDDALSTHCHQLIDVEHFSPRGARIR